MTTDDVRDDFGPSRAAAIVTAARSVAGIDIGGTKIAVLVVDADGAVLGRATRPPPWPTRTAPPRSSRRASTKRPRAAGATATTSPRSASACPAASTRRRAG